MPRLSVFVPLAMATGVLLAGCGGSSSTTDSPAVVPPTGSAGSVPSAAASAGGHGAGGASATTSSTPSANAAGSQPASAASGGSGAAAGQPAATGTVPLPPTGSYTYAIQGKSTSALGSQSLNGNSSLVIESLSPTSERSTQRDKSGSTAETLVARAGGLYLADIHLTQTGFDEDFKPAKPVLLFPASAHRGQQWTWHMTSTDGKYTLSAKLSVTNLHSSATTTHGQRYRTVSLSSVLHLTSKDIDVTITQQDEATRDAVIVREHSVSDGTAYGTKFHSDATRVLASRP